MKEKYYIYFDTSEPEALIRIYRSNELLAEERWAAHRELSATLSDKYTNILKKVDILGEDITGLIVFVGPGSFTGLRIGLSFANALAYALNIPIYETKKRGEFNLRRPKKVALPFYGAAPHITKSSRK